MAFLLLHNYTDFIKKQAETSVIITANFCLLPYFSVFFVLFPFYCVLSVVSSSGFL